ncbi:MTH1187 family thiamine-binding protein [Ramlibacter sp.]|uniref:MTH1187 family thiamine-binding protein n=1 Tax=Ramlibacter sp. TaxID=1917967 RepID=UPI002FCB4FAD
MVLLEFAMSPTTTSGGESLSPWVARILDIVDQSGLSYQLTAMGTLLEGDWDEVMAVVGACFHALQADCPRIGMNLKMDYRAGDASRLRSKVDAVEGQLGRKLRT